MDTDAFDLQEIKSVTVFLYSDNLYSLILAVNIVIYLSLHNYDTHSTYSPHFAIKIVHYTTLTKHILIHKGPYISQNL